MGSPCGHGTVSKSSPPSGQRRGVRSVWLARIVSTSPSNYGPPTIRPHSAPARALKRRRGEAAGYGTSGGRCLEGEPRAKDQRAARRRLRAMASKPALIINTVLEGSGTLATRNPRDMLPEFDGALL